MVETTRLPGDAADAPEPASTPGPADASGDPADGEAPGDPSASRAARLRAWRQRRRAQKALRSKLRRRLTRSGIAVAVVVVVVLAASLLGYTEYRNGQIHRIDVKNLSKIPTVGAEKGVEDVLLVGSTSRCALKVQNAAYGLCQDGVNGVNGDVVMVVRLDPATHRVSLLSFPRDTFLPNARPGQYNRIDSALYVGPGQLVSTIEDDFGVPINHYVVLNFDTFASVVGALGGVKMYFPDRMYDNYSQLDVTHTGCIYLDGTQALALVRARHTYYWTKGQKMNVAAIKAGDYSASGGEYDGSGDIGRIERDHIFLKVLASAVAKRGLGNPIADNALLGAIAPQLEVDSGFGIGEMLGLVLAFRGVNVAKAPETTLPVVEDTQPYVYKGASYGDLVFPSEPQDQEAIDAFMGEPDPGAKLSPSSVSVSVLGGIGSPAATARTASQLTTLGYHVRGASEQTPVGPISETSVIYSPGHLEQGERVLASLSGAVSLGVGKTLDGADVTVVTGTDFQVHGGSLPRAATTAASTGAAPAASAVSLATLVSQVELASGTSPGYADNGVIAPPTPANVAVPSYDPRACPAAPAKGAKSARKTS